MTQIKKGAESHHFKSRNSNIALRKNYHGKTV